MSNPPRAVYTTDLDREGEPSHVNSKRRSAVPLHPNELRVFLDQARSTKKTGKKHLSSTPSTYNVHRKKQHNYTKQITV
jgi:hypothetical protein